MGVVKLICSYCDEDIQELNDRLQLFYDDGYRIAHVVESVVGNNTWTTYVLEKF